jgi:hypothetical protein
MNGFMCHLIRETSLVVFPLNASFATGGFKYTLF